MSRRIRRLVSIFVLLATTLLLLPAPAQESAPPATTDKPGTTAPKPSSPTESTSPAEEADAPPDLGENVSADNSVSFPVDI
jgi:hypothetical protein